MTRLSEVPLDDLIQPVSNWNPQRSGDGSSFQYIDLSSVNQEAKVITASRTINCADAPSRARQLVAAGDVLVSTVRPNLNGVAAVPPEMDGATASTGFCVLRPNPDRLDGRFLFHWVRSPRFIDAMVRRATGASYPAITDRIVLSCRLYLPTLAEQRRIADILDQVDELRSERRRALAHLDDLIRAVFIEMFGDPITNPRRWPNPTLGKLLTYQQYGPRFYNEAYSAEGVRIIRITDLNEAGELDFSAMPRMAVTSEERQKYALRAGDLIFARTGATVGKVALIRPSDPVCIAGAYFITMRFDATVEPVYAKAVLTSPSIRTVVAKQSRQAAQQNFSGPALRRLPLPVPPLDLQRRFVRIANTVDDKLRVTYRGSLSQLNALFFSLQHRAFQGEL